MPLSHLIFIPAVFLVGALTGFAAATPRAGGSLPSTAAAGTVSRTALVSTLGVFLITLLATHFAPIPGGVRALRASVNHQKLFDQSPAFSPDEIYRRIVAFGEVGRETYQQFTYTTDVIFPFTLFLFLFVLARFTGERAALAKLTRISLSIGPVLWFVSDLVENGVVYFLLKTYPTRHALPATMLAYVTMSKFSLLLASFVLPLAVYVMSLRKAAPIEEIA
jgi:hypothetical protein